MADSCRSCIIVLVSGQLGMLLDSSDQFIDGSRWFWLALNRCWLALEDFARF